MNKMQIQRDHRAGRSLVVRLVVFYNTSARMLVFQSVYSALRTIVLQYCMTCEKITVYAMCVGFLC